MTYKQIMILAAVFVVGWIFASISDNTDDDEEEDE